MKIFITNNSRETQKLGEQFAARSLLVASKTLASQGDSLSRSVVLALYGDLGSGKTTFVQGLAKGLGIERRIISPTFIIVRSYKLKSQSANLKTTTQNLKLFYHIDLYRIEDEKDLIGLGLEEIMGDPQNIVVIEWAEKMKDMLPKRRIDIYFEYLNDKKRRIIIR